MIGNYYLFISNKTKGHESGRQNHFQSEDWYQLKKLILWAVPWESVELGHNKMRQKENPGKGSKSKNSDALVVRDNWGSASEERKIN